jgi:soluble lytic murein transglycosylase-like protein
LNPKIRRFALTAVVMFAGASVVGAQTSGVYTPSSPYGPAPYATAPSQQPPTYTPPTPYVPSSGYRPPNYAPAASPSIYGQGPQSDGQALTEILAASKSGDGARIHLAMAGIQDPLARKIALWVLADSAPDSMSYAESESARRDLAGWPAANRRVFAAQQRLVVAEADSEFQAGWTALTHYKDAKAADEHFARLQAIGHSPLTQSRALYWRGRAAEAMGDPVAAQLFFGQAARYQTTFYGQLAASKGGAATILLGHDPVVTAADRARFEAREPIRAARLLAQIGAKDAFKSFVAALSDMLPTTAEEALLVDFARVYGDQTLAMRVVRNAARRDLILPERGYPIRSAPGSYDAPESAFVLGITRQESGFDPEARSGAGARGMMQLMPATAQIVAQRLGLGYGDLDDPAYNMKLGSAFLGQLVSQFGGSYVMAAAAYNAGPGRPPQWAMECGDPRSASTDPVDFIECIPFSETRDYVMRVMEATQIYRARLNGGTAPDTLERDLKRGGYGYASFGPAKGVGGGAR